MQYELEQPFFTFKKERSSEQILVYPSLFVFEDTNRENMASKYGLNSLSCWQSGFKMIPNNFSTPKSQLSKLSRLLNSILDSL